jgi:glycosyltransferase involved in cell wall biosynthesis
MASRRRARPATSLPNASARHDGGSSLRSPGAIGRREWAVKVVFATADVPWQAASGAKLRDLGLYRAMADEQLTLVCFPIWAQPTEPLGPEVARVFPAPWPDDALTRVALRAAATVRGRQVFQEHLDRQGAIRRLAGIVREVEPDVVVLGHPLYDGFLPAVRPLVDRLVVDLWQLRSVGARQRLRTSAGVGRRARAALDLLVLERLDREIPRYADEVWFVEPRDAETFAERYGSPTRVVPNTIRLSAYEAYRHVAPRPATIGFVGIFSFDPNLTAAVRLLRGILPRLRAVRPDARLVLIGRAPPASLRSLVERTAGAELRADVPDAMAELAAAGPLVAPLEAGTGTRLKILEAAASGIPVITTPLGAAGLELEPDRELLLATSDDAFVRAILRVWDEPGLRPSLIDAAYRRVATTYDDSVLRVTVARGLRGEPEPAEEG